MPDSIPSRALRPDMPFAQAAAEALAGHLATLHVWANFLSQPDRAHEHHQMRIAAKRLRYALDAFAGVLPEEATACIAELKALQDELGKLHDLDALFLTVEQAMIQKKTAHGKHRNEADRTRTARQRVSLETLLSAIAAERDAQHRRCMERWADVLRRDAFAPLRRAIDDLAAQPALCANFVPPQVEDSSYEK